MELLLQVPEARVGVAKLLDLLPSMYRDMSFERESAFELPRAVAAREAAPATAELLGSRFLSYCNRFRRRQHLQRCSYRGHGEADRVVAGRISVFYVLIFIYLIVERSMLYVYSSISSQIIRVCLDI